MQVGAQTETELKEKKLRVEDALNATKVGTGRSPCPAASLCTGPRAASTLTARLLVCMAACCVAGKPPGKTPCTLAAASQACRDVRPSLTDPTRLSSTHPLPHPTHAGRG